MRLCLNPLENRNQEPLDSLPDSGIFRLPISGDVQSFDLRILTQPLNDVRRKDDVTRRDQHQGLRQSSQTSSVVLARSVGGAEPQCSVRLPNVTSGSSCVTPRRHRFGAVQTPQLAVREPSPSPGAGKR